MQKERLRGLSGDISDLLKFVKDQNPLSSKVLSAPEMAPLTRAPHSIQMDAPTGLALLRLMVDIEDISMTSQLDDAMSLLGQVNTIAHHLLQESRPRPNEGMPRDITIPLVRKERIEMSGKEILFEQRRIITSTSQRFEMSGAQLRESLFELVLLPSSGTYIYISNQYTQDNENHSLQVLKGKVDELDLEFRRPSFVTVFGDNKLGKFNS